MNQVRPNSLLALLTPAEEPEFFDHLTDFAAEKHTVLQRAGEVVSHVYFPVSGMISHLTVMRDGTAVETAAVGYDSVSGSNFALSGRNTNCQTIVQLNLKALRIARQHFINTYEKSPGVRHMVHIANELYIEQIQQVAACNILHQADARLARWLSQAHHYAGQDVLNLTQDFVSEMLGVRRTTISAVAQSLQSEGLIKYQRGHVTVVDPGGLQRRACKCYGTIVDRYNSSTPQASRGASV